MRFSYRKDVLESGTKVISESSRDAGSVSLGVWVGVGASCEPQNLAGVSHFIEHILFKGTHRRSAFEIANALESVGGSIDAFAGRETTAFVSRCLPDDLRRPVDVIGDMLCRPTMSRKAIEMEKQVIFEEIRNFEDTPEEIVHELLARSVWNSDPMGKPILGSMDSVSNLSRESMLSFFRSFYVAANTIVSASGRVDHDKLVGYVRRMMKIPGRPSGTMPEQHRSAIPRVHHDRRKVSQCYICMGTEGPPYSEARRYANILLSMLIGGGMTSRLFQNVREKEALAYSVYCSCEFYKRTGIFSIFLAVDPKKARRAVSRVCKELRCLKSDGLDKVELRSLKQQMKGSLVLGMESTAVRMNRLARQEIYLNDYLPVGRSLRTAMGIRRDDIMREARRLLEPSRFSLVTVGPTWTDFPSEEDIDF
jgi:predicted Zn-dependent peptidase